MKSKMNNKVVPSAAPHINTNYALDFFNTNKKSPVQSHAERFTSSVFMNRSSNKLNDLVASGAKSRQSGDSSEDIDELTRIQADNKAILKTYVAMNPFTLRFNNSDIERDYQVYYEYQRRFVIMATFTSIIICLNILCYDQYDLLNQDKPITDTLLVGFSWTATAICSLCYLSRLHFVLVEFAQLRAQRKRSPCIDIEQGSVKVDTDSEGHRGLHEQDWVWRLAHHTVWRAVAGLRRPLPSDNVLMLTMIGIGATISMTGENASLDEDGLAGSFTRNGMMTSLMIFGTLTLSRMPYVHALILGIALICIVLYVQNWQGNAIVLAIINATVVFSYSLRISELAFRRDFRLTRRLAAENIDVKVDTTTRGWFEEGTAIAGGNNATQNVSKAGSMIEEDDLTFGPVLGSGAFGIVMQGEWKGTKVAIKKIHGSIDKNSVMGFGTESAIMAQLRHPNIVMYMGTCLKPVMMVMELMPRGALYNVIHVDKVILDWSLRLRILQDAASGMNFLHSLSNQIVHNDLKSLNLLVDDNWRAKVCDFGFSEFRQQIKSSNMADGDNSSQARPLEQELEKSSDNIDHAEQDNNRTEGSNSETSKSTKSKGKGGMATIGWASPEAIMDENLTEKNDVYAFGVVIFELVALQVPFAKVNREAIALAVCDGKRPSDFISETIPELIEQVVNPVKQKALFQLVTLMNQCWEQDPEERPDFPMVVQSLRSIVESYAGGKGKSLDAIYPKNNNQTAAEALETDLEDTGDFSISPDQLEIGPKIGSGGYGEVYEAILHGTHVAVKQFHNSSISEAALKEFNKECRLMLKMRHPNVVLFMGSWTRPPKLQIVTELLTRGSLYYSYKNSPKPKDPAKLRNIFFKVAEGCALGLNYLHNQSPAVIHRDMKSPNVLLDENWNAKVADFGLSRIREEGKVLTSVGSPLWAAPEVLRAEGPGGSFPSDVYSYGIVLWETLEWQEPYPGMSPSNVMRGVAYKKMRPEISEDVSPGIKLLLQNCWEDKPEDRPTFSQIIETLESISQP